MNRDEPDNQELPEWYATATNNTRRLFRHFHAKTWGDIYRALYKGTECGVSVGIAIEGMERPVYCRDLYKFDVSAPVVTVFISSIVEGVDFDCETLELDLTKQGTSKTGNIVKRLFGVCEQVEEEAAHIWSQTHGCPKCKLEGEWGHPAINPKCRACKGKGQVI